jgi:hypothetical protein
MAKRITATGLRGFLEWFQQDQPGIYAKVAPHLPKLAPQAFSAYTRRSKTLRGIYKTGMSHRSPQRLADYCFGGCFDIGGCFGADTPTCDVLLSGNSLAPVSVDYSSSLSTLPSYSGAGPSYTALPTDSSGNLITAPCPGSSGGSIAQAANTGTSGVATTSAIGNAINAVAGTVMNAQNAAALAALVASQLNQAANGQAPKTVSSSSLGIPVVAAKSSTTGILLLALLAGGAIWALG